MDATGASTDALHLPLGLLALQGFNEVLDTRDLSRWTWTIKWSEAWPNTLATLALPTAIAAAWMPWRRTT